MNEKRSILELREGNRNIAEAVSLMWRVFLRFEAPEYPEEGIREFQEYITAAPQKLAAKELRLWACFEENKVIGAIAVRPPSHVSLLFVDEAYHRQGIARTLYEAALRAVQEGGGGCEMTVHASPYAEEAYRRLGFVATGPERTVNGLRFTPMRHRF